MDRKIEDSTEEQYISSSRGCCIPADLEHSHIVVNQQRCCKLSSYDWLSGVNDGAESGQNFVEVRFKNGRKDFFSYPGDMNLNEGELVAVEAAMF